ALRAPGGGWRGLCSGTAGGSWGRGRGLRGVAVSGLPGRSAERAVSARAVGTRAIRLIGAPSASLVGDEPGARLEVVGLLGGEGRGVLVVEILPRHADPLGQALLQSVPGGELVLPGAVAVSVQHHR